MPSSTPITVSVGVLQVDVASTELFFSEKLIA